MVCNWYRDLIGLAIRNLDPISKNVTMGLCCLLEGGVMGPTVSLEIACNGSYWRAVMDRCNTLLYFPSVHYEHGIMVFGVMWCCSAQKIIFNKLSFRTFLEERD